MNECILTAKSFTSQITLHFTGVVHAGVVSDVSLSYKPLYLSSNVPPAAPSWPTLVPALGLLRPRRWLAALAVSLHWQRSKSVKSCSHPRTAG